MANSKKTGRSQLPPGARDTGSPRIPRKGFDRWGLPQHLRGPVLGRHRVPQPLRMGACASTTEPNGTGTSPGGQVEWHGAEPGLRGHTGTPGTQEEAGRSQEGEPEWTGDRGRRSTPTSRRR